MKLLSEDRHVKQGLAPQDAAGGVESARISLRNCNAIAIVLESGVGIGTTFDITLRQHDAASAGNSADLVSTIPHYYKVAGASAFTRVDGSTAAMDMGGDLDLPAGTVVVEVEPDDLLEGYDHISLVVTAPGAAKIMSVSYMVDTKNKPAYKEVY